MNSTQAKACLLFADTLVTYATTHVSNSALELFSHSAQVNYLQHTSYWSRWAYTGGCMWSWKVKL